jgi:hypothetical protein
MKHIVNTATHSWGIVAPIGCMARKPGTRLSSWLRIFSFELGVLLAPLDQAQSVGEVVGGVALDHQPAEQRERGLTLRTG